MYQKLVSRVGKLDMLLATLCLAAALLFLLVALGIASMLGQPRWAWGLGLTGFLALWVATDQIKERRLGVFASGLLWGLGLTGFCYAGFVALGKDPATTKFVLAMFLPFLMGVWAGSHAWLSVHPRRRR